MKVTGDTLKVRCEGILHKADCHLNGIEEFVIGEHAAGKLSGLRIAVITRVGQIGMLLAPAAYNRGPKTSWSTP